EDVAERVVNALREQLVDERGAPAIVLARFYKTIFAADLEEPLRAVAASCGRDGGLEPGTRCLALLASAGERAEWNDRRRSRHHQCIPLPSGDVVASMPMVSQLMRQLGVKLDSFDRGSTGLLVDLDHHHLSNVFYVPEAAGSPCIPDQAGFVEPYGIRSVV